MTEFPMPMVPADVDLRGLEYMPLLGDRLFSSNFDMDATDAEFRIGLKLWWAAWNQVPAGSLPKEDHRQRKLAGLDENLAKWRKVRARALAGFVECNDGRLYHPVVVEQALIAWEKRAENREKRGNEAERKRRERAERARMFEQLRGAGITPTWNIATSDLRALVTEHVTRTGGPHVTPPVTRTGTAMTGRDGTGRDKEEDPALPPPEAPPATKVGQVGMALKRGGLDPTRFNLSNPELLELIRQGATPDEFEGVARDAVRKGIAHPFPWVLTVVASNRKRAAAVALAPPQAQTVPSTDADRTRTLLNADAEHRRIVEAQRQARLANRKREAA